MTIAIDTTDTSNSTSAAAAALNSGLTPAGVKGVYNFKINGAPPFSTINTFINGVNYNGLVAPGPDYNTGDPLITDENGSVQGRIIVIRSYGSLSQDDNLTVLFYDASTNKLVSTYPITTLSNSTDDTTTRSAITIPSGNSSSSVDDATNISKLGVFASTISPYTQTFIVPGGNGITVTSIDLYFGSKDDTAPVAIQLRKVENGVPSSNEIISGTVSVKMPNNVYVDAVNEIIDTENGKAFARAPVLPTPTNFKIMTKLAPGEYGISIITDSRNYTLFTTKFGTNYAKQPNIGKLFKSQNVGTWIEEENAGICFRLNKAKFYTGTKYFELNSQAGPYTEYDNIFLKASTIEDLVNQKINFTFKGSELGAQPPIVNTFGAAVSIDKNTPIKLLTRKASYLTGSMVLGVTLENHNEDSSPILDKSSLALMTLKNEIELFDADASDSELSPAGGFALSKYISKITTLASEFDSTGLEVRVDVNRKIGTDIEVYCKVLSPKDIAVNNTIDTLSWRRMPIFNKSASATNADSLNVTKKYVGLSDTEFNTEVYKILEEDSVGTTGIPNLSYTRLLGGVSTTFTTFNVFQIKIVMYSENTAIVPKIKNLIATAVI